MLKTLKYIFLPLLIFSIMVSFSPKTTYACSCVVPGTAEVELEESAAVFSGEVVAVKDSKKESLQISAEPYAVTFKVDNWWKGEDLTKEVTVYTPKSSASCGFEFALGEKYLVYADGDDGKLVVFLCSRTALLSAAKDDVVQLDKIKKPTEPTKIEADKVMDKEQPTPEKSTDVNPTYLVLLIVGILFVAIFLTRRIKK